MWGSFLRVAALVPVAILLLSSAPAWSQDRPYKEGSIWTVTFVKTKNGLGDDYLREIIPVTKHI